MSRKVVALRLFAAADTFLDVVMAGRCTRCQQDSSNSVGAVVVGWVVCNGAFFSMPSRQAGAEARRLLVLLTL